MTIHFCTAGQKNSINNASLYMSFEFVLTSVQNDKKKKSLIVCLFFKDDATNFTD